MIWSHMDESIVENWLRSLGMVQYTQSFIDNGYDDLEICKQIGDEDLDAIGVTKESHRKEILEAVAVLLKYGGARVYFTLDPEYQRLKALQAEREKLNADYSPTTNHNGVSSKGIVNGIEETSFMTEPVSLMGNGDCLHPQSLNGISKLHNGHPELPPLPSILDSESIPQTLCGSNPKYIVHSNGNSAANSFKRTSLVTFSKLHLTAIIQDKLSEDGINLADYGSSEHADTNPESSIEILAMKYANDLHTHHQDVFQVLLDLRRSSTNCDTPSPMEDREWMQTAFSLFSVNGQCHRSIPPPLPPRPPPSNIYEDPLELDASLKASPAHSSRSPLLPQQRLEEMSECQINEDEAMMKRRSLTLGRLLRGGFKKQPKKYVYKQYKGDLSASEITMPDEERIELMIRVKEGKLSMHDAVERVKQYEENKKEPPLQTTLVNGHGHI